MNKRLIIIGNGFDLDHGLNTYYSGFRKYLLNNKYRDNYAIIPSPVYDHHGEEHFDEDELKNFLFQEIQGDGDDEWSDFEERLGYLDFEENLVSLPELGNADGNEWHDVDDNEDNMHNAFLAFSHLTDLFIEWLNSIVDDYKDDYKYNKNVNSIKTKSKFAKLLTGNTEILIFNYTNTVEDLYDFYGVNHIHGTLSNEDIVLGHSQIIDTEERFLGADDIIADIEQSLRKNTNSIIKNNTDFFEGLCDIDEVYTYGFSFSSVDMPYIIEIIKNIPRKAKWFLHKSKYEVTNEKAYTQKLKSNDFVGAIKEWL